MLSERVGALLLLPAYQMERSTVARNRQLYHAPFRGVSQRSDQASLAAYEEGLQL